MAISSMEGLKTVWGCCTTADLTWRFVDLEPQLFCQSCGSVWESKSGANQPMPCPDLTVHNRLNGWGCCSSPELDWEYGELDPPGSNGESPRVKCRACATEWWKGDACPDPDIHTRTLDSIYGDTCCSSPELEGVKQGESLLLTCRCCSKEYGTSICTEPRDHNDEEFQQRVKEQVEKVMGGEWPEESNGPMATDTDNHTDSYWHGAWTRFYALTLTKTQWSKGPLRDGMLACLVESEPETASESDTDIDTDDPF